MNAPRFLTHLWAAIFHDDGDDLPSIEEAEARASELDMPWLSAAAL